ncbi:hypothetical protein QZH41_006933 [Actinostola sp. cb2023]|nr:hypothetical protein QZH41_006933 [Actinostola sp. cb2023]
MKFLPRKFRESQRDWFGKRGLPWHITVATKRNDDGEMEMLTFVHIFESCSQDSTTVLAIIHDVLRQLRAITPEIHSVFLRQDNVGCYHSASTLLSLPMIAKTKGINIQRIDFSDPQGGKGACDRNAANIKNHMRRYLNSGNDIETAEQMKSAIESFGGIPGVRVMVCALHPTTDGVTAKWEGVSHINNIAYINQGVRVWRAYDTGPEMELSWNKFCLPSTVPMLNYTSDTTDLNTISFVTVKARVQSKKSQETNTQDDDATECEESGDYISSSQLFFCPEQGCIKSFQRFTSLEKHLDCDSHTYILEHETLYDKAMTLYATEFEKGTSRNPEIPVEHHNVSPLDIGPGLPMGWALKSTTAKKKRFTDAQRKYLVDVFNAGEQSGQKVDPVNISKAMRIARYSDGSRMFEKGDFLTPQQIVSFFSRLASKKRIDVAATEDDGDADINELVNTERDIQELSNKIIDTIGVKHPIMFDTYNLCELATQRKLSKFSINMLQEICASLELDIFGIKKNRKKPYIDTLEKLVSRCGC